jgi:hypothetical protein
MELVQPGRGVGERVPHPQGGRSDDEKQEPGDEAANRKVCRKRKYTGPGNEGRWEARRPL